MNEAEKEIYEKTMLVTKVGVSKDEKNNISQNNSRRASLLRSSTGN